MSHIFGDIAGVILERGALNSIYTWQPIRGHLNPPINFLRNEQPPQFKKINQEFCAWVDPNSLFSNSFQQSHTASQISNLHNNSSILYSPGILKLEHSLD